MITVLFISLTILSFSLTYIVRKIAIKKNVIDIPNNRSSHKKPTPRGGGLATVISYCIGLTVLFYYNYIEEKLFYALLSGILLSIIGILDDIFSLKPITRFFIQILTSFLALYFLGGLRINEFDLENKLLYFLINIVTVVGMVWFINLYNFLDGIDAYASLEGIFISIALFVFTGSPLLLIIIASILGFLFWNWPKAKIFMGDVGSTQLGFILIVLGIYFHNEKSLNLIYWFMLSSVFWFDASLTLFRRWKNKEKLSQAHKKHAYQRIVQAGFSHLKTDIFMLLLNLIIFILVRLSYSDKNLIIPVLLIILILLYLATRIIDNKVPFSQDNN